MSTDLRRGLSLPLTAAPQDDIRLAAHIRIGLLELSIYILHFYKCSLLYVFLFYCANKRNTASTIARLGYCVDDICHWMAANRLQMNPAKTELLWAGSKHNISSLGSHAPVLHLHLDTVTASDHVRVLGVTFSSDLSLERHVSKTCSASFH